jgi:microcystin-dependent protein
MKKLLLTSALLLFMSLSSFAQIKGFIGEVKLTAGTYAPRGWAICVGQILPISQNTALFSILGTSFGGDGRTTFALPDLRGRVPVGVGTGPGIVPVRIGQQMGVTQTNLTTGDHLVVTGHTPTLGMHYIICLYGDYPPRD